MGLKSNGSCGQCGAIGGGAQHILRCKNSDRLWSCVERVFGKMGAGAVAHDKIFGLPAHARLKTIFCTALLAVYQGFLRAVNSGQTDSDLVKIFKQKLFERIYISFLVAKSENRLTQFNKFWGDGVGLYKIVDTRIEIRL